MSTAPIYRPMVAEDVTPVVELMQRISAFRPALDDLEQFWNAYSAQNNVVTVAAELNGSVIGCASMFLEYKLRGGIVGHIEDVVVASDHSGKGIGRAMIEYLLRSTPEAYKITLVCADHNIQFYEKLGFVPGLKEMRILR